LTGLDQPTEGTVTVDPARIGFSAIDQAIYPHLTAQEHVQLFLDLRGTGSADILKTVDLDYAQDTLASQLSSGMRARLKLALAIMHEPNVLILDEPSATLDASGIDRLGSAIQAQLKRGCAILATNDAADRQWATAELELGASTE
jgi:ABC-type multidrug transport system ATPase subunit